jgi:hypothetical protein
MELSTSRLSNLEVQFQRDVDQFRKRDARSDVKIADYVLDHYRARPMFFTWGHVSGELIAELAIRLLNVSKDILGGDAATFESQIRPLHTAVSDFWMPIHPAVAKWHKLAYCKDDQTLFNIYGNWWTFKTFMIKYIEYDQSW